MYNISCPTLWEFCSCRIVLEGNQSLFAKQLGWHYTFRWCRVSSITYGSNCQKIQLETLLKIVWIPNLLPLLVRVLFLSLFYGTHVESDARLYWLSWYLQHNWHLNLEYLRQLQGLRAWSQWLKPFLKHLHQHCVRLWRTKRISPWRPRW